MSRRIELHTSLDVPAGLARDELLRITSAIHERRPPYEETALHVGLHDLHFPLGGEVAVPVEAHVVDRPIRYACTIEIAAGDGAKFFPTFSGTISVNALGSAASELWLQGRYDVPFGALGAAVDATFFAGAAERSLDGLLELVAAAVSANVKRDQALEVSRRGRSRG